MKEDNPPDPLSVQPTVSVEHGCPCPPYNGAGIFACCSFAPGRLDGGPHAPRLGGRAEANPPHRGTAGPHRPVKLGFPWCLRSSRLTPSQQLLLRNPPPLRASGLAYEYLLLTPRSAARAAPAPNNGGLRRDRGYPPYSITPRAGPSRRPMTITRFHPFRFSAAESTAGSGRRDDSGGRP